MDSDATHTTASLSNEESLSREEFLQILKKNDSFKVEIKVSFKSEIAEKNRINNLVITKTFNQKFAAFQKIMLQTVQL